MQKQKKSLLDPNFSSIVYVHDVALDANLNTDQKYEIDHIRNKCVPQQNDNNSDLAIDHDLVAESIILSSAVSDESDTKSVSEVSLDKYNEHVPIMIEDDIPDNIQATTVQDEMQVDIPAVNETIPASNFNTIGRVILTTQSKSALSKKNSIAQQNEPLKTRMKPYMTRFTLEKAKIPSGIVSLKNTFQSHFENPCGGAKKHVSYTPASSDNHIKLTPFKLLQPTDDQWAIMQYYDERRQKVVDPRVTRREATKKLNGRLSKTLKESRRKIIEFINTAPLLEVESLVGARAAVKVYETRPVTYRTFTKIAREESVWIECKYMNKRLREIVDEKEKKYIE
ncbi:hypothetical protein K501DRAFT_336468 [Backusella circina FSU 941]|nr:hypothetical protein K501DRAFT_336468 [Backusella circina FSU 941]